MKTYVITGATSGIGKALTEYFCKENIVFAGYRNEDKKKILENLSENIIPFYVDYAKPQTIKNAYEFICSKTEHIDTVLNVAGCVVAGAIDCISIEEIKRQFDVNVFGGLEFTKGLLPLLDDSKVINISSMSSYGIYPFIAPYCASKRAMDILFNCFSLETQKDIKVVSMKLGVIATPLWTKSIKENETNINNSSSYENETKYLKNNAIENEENGLSPQKVVEKIAKIDKLKNPKPTYLVGVDAIATAIVSRLPQGILNKIIKFKLSKIK